jgi:hypothetical protein
MHAEIVSNLVAKVGVDLAAHSKQRTSKSAFKGMANLAVRKEDMKRIKRERQSTVTRYLELRGEPSVFPTQMATCLSGVITTGQKAMLLARAGALLPRPHNQTGACPCCRTPGAPDLRHMLVSCPTWALHRADMWAAILTVPSQSEVNRVQGGDSNATMVAALLGAGQLGRRLRAGVYPCPVFPGRNLSLLACTCCCDHRRIGDSFGQ